jgi:branched chain amino acid efflux pump
MNEPLAHGPFLAIAAMAAATYLTRWAGYWLMAHIPLTRRVRRMLEVLPGAIMAATVVPLVAKAGLAALLAVLVALGAMIVRRNEFLAVGLGLATAALARLAGG